MMSDSETTSLHLITELEFDAGAEIFRHYPAFKLGVVNSVRYYARLMFPLLKKLIGRDSQYDSWIVTAPPIIDETPAAANLLCWELFELYTQEHPRPVKELSLIDIQYDDQAMASIDWDDPINSRDYATLNFAERVSSRERLGRQLLGNADLEGNAVLFVNDICVTGAQQDSMQAYFDNAGAACVRWLYIIVVAPEIGRTKPGIESQINFAPFEELLRLVSRDQIQFTGKCVQRLMGLSIAELEQILLALDRERRSRLLELAFRNGFESLDGFHEQMKLIRSYEQQNRSVDDFQLE